MNSGFARMCGCMLMFAATLQGRAADDPQRFPRDGATNVNPDTHLMLTFDTPPTLGSSGFVRVFDATTNALVDSIDLSIPASPRPTGRGPSTEAERVALGASTKMSDFQINRIGGVDFHYFPIVIRGAQVMIDLHNNTLEYGHKYRVEIDPGVLRTAADNLTVPYHWTFTTKPTAPRRDVAQVTVAADGGGDFNTVQGAIDFAAAERTQRLTILISKGRYEEIVFMNDPSNLTIRGEDREGVQVGYANNSAFNPPRGGPSRRPAFSINNGRDVQLSTFTIRNGFVGQAEALLVRGERIVLDRMTLKGSGDALTTYGSIYMVDSTLSGDGDTILGYAALFCLRCEVHSVGPFTWTRTPQGSHGNVFVDSTFVGIDAPLPWTVKADGTGGQKSSKVLARLPRNGPSSSSRNFPFAEMVLINSRLSGVPPEGWGPIEEPPEFDASNVKFLEYNSRDMQGRPIDVSKRHPVSKQLEKPRDAKLIESYSTPAFVLGGWTPVVR